MSIIPIYSAARQPSPSKLIPVGIIIATVFLTVGLAVLGAVVPALAQIMSAPAQKTVDATKTDDGAVTHRDERSRCEPQG
jgi:hypothetical protein